ncbi:unnamed protein product [Triticum turgidum subsp. durum]|uniref:Uncharacterized protein n=1 Tax=Triticum turgidum subsp. durum TaxID=4567 RepID=A0A9R1SAD2_TRITD|nr:unnamed protein product [Triticum turgidum subsp. durum]
MAKFLPYRALLPIAESGRRIWLSTHDATTIRYLTVEHRRLSLHDPLTGAVTRLPLLPHKCCVDGRWEENLHGAVYADGTTLLYGVSTVFEDTKTIASFTAVLLQPGDAEWTLVETIFENTNRSREYCATYRNGRILDGIARSALGSSQKQSWLRFSDGSRENVWALMHKNIAPIIILYSLVERAVEVAGDAERAAATARRAKSYAEVTVASAERTATTAEMAESSAKTA